MRVSEGNEVMHEIDWPDMRSIRPFPKSVGIQPGVADVQIDPILPLAVETTPVAQHTQRELAAEIYRRAFEKLEQFLGCILVQDTPEPLMMNHGLGTAAEVTEIGEADPVDASRITAHPAPPDQPRYIEQKGGIVSHSDPISRQ